MDQISGLRQKCPDFSKIMSGILDPRIPTFWNPELQHKDGGYSTPDGELKHTGRWDIPI